MSDTFDDSEALAAEYVLGTLDREERRRAEARLATDQAFARMVDDWSRRLGPLSEAVPPVAPPPEVWAAIEAALPAERRAAVQSARPGQQRSPRPTKQMAPLFERLGFWRWATGGAVAVAAALALAIALVPLRPVQETRYMAVLESGPGKPAWLVSVDIAARQMTVRPLGELALADKSYELWLVAGPEAPPQSLGLLTPDSDKAIPISADLGSEVPRAAAFAVSLEPAGGSPTGLPTGPVLYQGAILPVEEP